MRLNNTWLPCMGIHKQPIFHTNKFYFHILKNQPESKNKSICIYLINGWIIIEEMKIKAMSINRIIRVIYYQFTWEHKRFTNSTTKVNPKMGKGSIGIVLSNNNYYWKAYLLKCVIYISTFYSDSFLQSIFIVVIYYY